MQDSAGVEIEDGFVEIIVVPFSIETEPAAVYLALLGFVVVVLETEVVG